jgi:hypothetical protein
MPIADRLTTSGDRETLLILNEPSQPEGKSTLVICAFWGKAYG